MGGIDSTSNILTVYCSEPMWGIEARNAAIANAYYTVAINRVGTVSVFTYITYLHLCTYIIYFYTDIMYLRYILTVRTYVTYVCYRLTLHTCITYLHCIPTLRTYITYLR